MGNSITGPTIDKTPYMITTKAGTYNINNTEGYNELILLLGNYLNEEFIIYINNIKIVFNGLNKMKDYLNFCYKVDITSDDIKVELRDDIYYVIDKITGKELLNLISYNKREIRLRFEDKGYGFEDIEIDQRNMLYLYMCEYAKNFINKEDFEPVIKQFLNPKDWERDYEDLMSKFYIDTEQYVKHLCGYTLSFETLFAFTKFRINLKANKIIPYMN